MRARLLLAGALAALLAAPPVHAWTAMKAAAVGSTQQVLLGGTLNLTTTGSVSYFPVSYSAATSATELLWGVVPAAGSITSIKLFGTVAPGSGKSYTVQLMQNGSPLSGATCALSNTATTNTCTVTAALLPGDRVSWQLTPSGTPASIRLSVSSIFTPTAANDTILMAQGTGFSTSAASATNPGSTTGGSLPSFRRTNVFPDGGTLDKYYVASNAPGTGTRYDYSLDVNAAASGSFLATISDTAISANDTTHSATVAAGNDVQLVGTPTGTPAAATAAFGIRYRPTTTGAFALEMSQGPGDSATVANYYNLTGGTSAGGTIRANQQNVAHAMTIKKMYVKINTAPGTGLSRTFALEVNGTPSAATCTISDTATSCNDTTHTVTVSDGDLLDTADTPSAGSPSASGNTAISYEATKP